jgi:hypothetical protein
MPCLQQCRVSGGSSSATSNLLPLSFRPSHITSSYFIGNAQDSLEWGSLASEHAVRLIVNCCASELGADWYRVTEEQEPIVGGVPEADDARQAASLPIRHNDRNDEQSVIWSASGRTRDVSRPPPAPARAFRECSQRNKRRYRREVLDSIRCSPLDDLDDNPQGCVHNVVSWVRAHLTSEVLYSSGSAEGRSGCVQYIELLLPMQDDPKFPLVMWLDKVCPLLLEVFPLRPDGTQPSPLPRVLVHCLAGISRSVSVVIGVVILAVLQNVLSSDILLELLPATATAAEIVQAIVSWIRSRRRFASPNPGFVSQLREYVARQKRQTNVI